MRCHLDVLWAPTAAEKCSVDERHPSLLPPPKLCRAPTSNMTDPDPLWSDPHIPNRLQVPPGSEGVDSPAAARFRQAILTASAFINTPHDSDRSGYVQKLQTCEQASP